MIANTNLVGGPRDGDSLQVPANYKGEPFFVMDVKVPDGYLVKYVRSAEPNEDGSWNFYYVPVR